MKALTNNDLQRGYVIPANTPITEVSVRDGVRRATSAKMTVDIPLDPKSFKVITPEPSDRILEHTCFEYTNLQGNVTYVYVRTDALRGPPSRPWSIW